MLDVQTRVRVDMKQRPDMDEEPLRDMIWPHCEPLVIRTTTTPPGVTHRNGTTAEN